jgi:hypothetical protein
LINKDEKDEKDERDGIKRIHGWRLAWFVGSFAIEIN